MSTPTQAKNAAPPPLDKKAVRIALATRGWTQAQLATRIGVSLASVSLTINHNSYPKVAAKIRKALSLA